MAYFQSFIEKYVKIEGYLAKTSKCGDIWAMNDTHIYLTYILQWEVGAQSAQGGVATLVFYNLFHTFKFFINVIQRQLNVSIQLFIINKFDRLFINKLNSI